MFFPPVYTPGVYTASAEGHGGGMVNVTVTFDEKSITEIVIDASEQTEAIGVKTSALNSRTSMVTNESGSYGRKVSQENLILWGRKRTLSTSRRAS